MDFKKTQEDFNKGLEKEIGNIIMNKVSLIVKDVGANFLEMGGDELSQAQSKLAGYKFYLADYAGDLNRTYEMLKLELKHIKAKEWDRITEEIKAKEGKVKNKEQIENALSELTIKTQTEQMLYETLYYKYKLKISSIDSILTAITQRLAELKRQLGQVN